MTNHKDKDKPEHPHGQPPGQAPGPTQPPGQADKPQPKEGESGDDALPDSAPTTSAPEGKNPDGSWAMGAGSTPDPAADSDVMRHVQPDAEREHETVGATGGKPATATGPAHKQE